LFVILISGANVFLSSSLKGVMTEGGLLAYAGSAVSILLSFVPYLLVWIFFIFLYKFMPTTPVKFKEAFVAGVLAGTVFQVVQWFYIKFQVGVTSYNAIYGSLAALPLFLVWMRLSWSIILWGTELCYVVRNQKVLYSDKVYENMSLSMSIDIAINILNFIADEFLLRNGILTLEMLTEKLQLSTNKLRIVLQRLVDKKILLEFKDDSDVYYYPAIDLHVLSIASLISKLSGIECDDKKEVLVNKASTYNWKKRYLDVVENEFEKDRFSKNL
ncbi:MAG: YihY/virulence factor BrkB family protein, partial [Bacteroides sp.]|nr:YihY/virulence factor BrkB family protein [Bacteroides sp.]